MCAITGSFSKNKLKELYNLNTYRGELSYSLTTFKPISTDAQIQLLIQNEGKMPNELIDEMPLAEGNYMIAHSQAPTTETDNIHPAVYGDCLLWHNGIIKQKEVGPTWDTLWLLDQIVNYKWGVLSSIDGTFACVYFNGKELFVFRNEISPLFIDDELNISSTKFDGCRPLTPNRVFNINLTDKSLKEVSYFTTKENPYFIPEIA